MNLSPSPPGRQENRQTKAEVGNWNAYAIVIGSKIV